LNKFYDLVVFYNELNKINSHNSDAFSFCRRIIQTNNNIVTDPNCMKNGMKRIFSEHLKKTHQVDPNLVNI